MEVKCKEKIHENPTFLGEELCNDTKYSEICKIRILFMQKWLQFWAL